MARAHELAHANGTRQNHAGALGLQAHDPAALLQRKRGKTADQLIHLVKRERMKMDERRVIGVESRVDGDKRRDRTTHADKALRIARLGGEAGFESLATERASLLQRSGRGWILAREEEVRHAATAHIQRTHGLKRHTGSHAVEHPHGHLGRPSAVIRNDDARRPKVLGHAEERERSLHLAGNDLSDNAALREAIKQHIRIRSVSRSARERAARHLGTGLASLGQIAVDARKHTRARILAKHARLGNALAKAADGRCLGAALDARGDDIGDAKTRRHGTDIDNGNAAHWETP